MQLTETDKKILESYSTLLDGLAIYLGSGCEIVLHSLENINESVIKIVNGQHTGRKVGAPITNLALDMLKKIQANSSEKSISYFTRNAKGEPLKSATIAIVGEKGRIIGLLCMNYYLNTPLSNFLSVFGAMDRPELTGTQEIFSKTQTELMNDAICMAKNSVYADNTILPSLKNKAIVESLYKQGFFKMKDSVQQAAENLGISKNTVYLHIRNIQKD